MPLFAIYLLKLTISLSIVWLFYQLALRRLTFYNWNRGYLIGYSALAFFMPFVNVANVLESGPSGARTIMQYIPVIGNGEADLVHEHAEIPGYFSRYSSWDLLFAILILGSSIFLLRLSIRWVSLWRLRRRAVPIGDCGLKIYQVEGQIVPFSFGNAIYGNRQLHTDKEWEEIILHEYIHIRQRHTLDILLAELLCVLNWYNPFAWLIRHSIRQNLEFIADSKVLENGCDKKGYQYHLLKVIGQSRYRLANNFNFSSLKKRIIMMNKIKSARLQLVKFLFLLPVAAVLLLAFRNRYQKIQAPVRNTPGATTRVSTGVLPGAAMDRVSSRVHQQDSIPSDTDASQDGPARPSTLSVRPVLVQSRDSFHNPLYFLGGVEIRELNNINASEIDHIDVYKSDSLLGKYGERGKNGAVFIYLKHPPSRDSVNTLIADTIDITVPKEKENKYVFFLNGKRIPDGVSFRSLVKKEDIGMIENSRDTTFLEKLGMTPGRPVINIITKDHKNDPGARLAPPIAIPAGGR